MSLDFEALRASRHDELLTAYEALVERDANGESLFDMLSQNMPGIRDFIVMMGRAESVTEEGGSGIPFATGATKAILVIWEQLSAVAAKGGETAEDAKEIQRKLSGLTAEEADRLTDVFLDSTNQKMGTVDGDQTDAVIESMFDEYGSLLDICKYVAIRYGRDFGSTALMDSLMGGVTMVGMLREMDLAAQLNDLLGPTEP